MSFLEELKSFLTANGCQDSEKALVPMEKLSQMVEASGYLLVASEEIDQEKLMKSVALLTDRVVSKVDFFSLESGELITEDIWGIGCMGFYLCIWDEDLKERLGAILALNLMEFLTTNFKLNKDLGVKLRDSISGHLGASITNLAGKNLGTSMLYYLSYCLLNDQEGAEKFKMLLEFWSQCIILGFKGKEPETLLVICK